MNGATNNWGIPADLETLVLARDKNCIYCATEMLQRVPRGQPRKMAATWEHIINDARIVTLENIARCCWACNSSKGRKTLAAWLHSAYCLSRGINEHTLAQIVKDALRTARMTPNHAMERTTDRCAFTLEMTSTLSPRATRGLVRRRSSCSR